MWLAVNMVAGLLEGVSMSLLYVAINFLMPESKVNLAEKLGPLGGFADNLAANIEPVSFFILLVVVVAVTQVFQSSFYFAGLSISTVLRMRVRKSLQGQTISQIMRLRYADVVRYKAGDLWTYLSFGRSLEKLIGVMNAILYVSLLATAYLVVLFLLSWEMTILSLLLFAVLSVGLRPVMGKIKKYAKILLDETFIINAKTMDYLSGMQLIRSIGEERNTQTVLKKYIDRNAKYTLLGTLWNGAVSPLMDIVAVLILCVSMIAIVLVVGDRITEVIPLILTFVFILFRLLPRLSTLNVARANFYQSLPVINMMVDFLRNDNKAFARSGGIPFGGLKKNIIFDNVDLDYGVGEAPAVHGLSFSLKKGQSLAIVGKSGAGKSSVVGLLLGLYDPTSGRVLIDGVPFEKLNLDDLRQRTGIVSQDTFLFHASIRENIMFGSPDASDDDLVKAAKMANAHGFIMELEKKYDTVVGDKGYRLSGGQKQRISLTRAILRDPDILILDEATSGLDSVSEKIIQDALKPYVKGRTVIAIAHRLSTIMEADNIIVMDMGQIVEQGSHKSLLSSGGLYESMWRLQVAGEDYNVS